MGTETLKPLLPSCLYSAWGVLVVIVLAQRRETESNRGRKFAARVLCGREMVDEDVCLLVDENVDMVNG